LAGEGLVDEVELLLRSFDLGRFAEAYHSLTAAQIRVLLRAWHSTPTALALFLGSLADVELSDSALVRSWRSALRALVGMHPRRTTSGPRHRHRSDKAMRQHRRANFKRAVARPEVVEALRAAVVGDPEAPWVMVEALAAEGGAEAVDALMVVFDRATKSAGVEAVARFRKLGEVARRTPHVRQLLASTAAEVKRRRPKAVKP
jgi:hypothetical protein